MSAKTRWLGLVLMLVIGAAFLAPGSALALPANSPAGGMICTPGTVSGTTHTFNLRAGTGYIQTPDGNSIFMWSYADANDPDPALSQFQSPGPTLCVAQGETVVINLTNTLPEPTSIVFPGQDSGVIATGGAAGFMTTEAAASGGTVTYTFNASEPGTYLYESGSDIAKQVEMGLYGALVVRPSMGANFAYNDASTQFDPAREYLILLGEIDPDLHHAVEIAGTSGAPAYDFTALHNRYFAVNGREFPDTLQDNGTGLVPSQPYGALVRVQPYDASTNALPALIRMLNAGVLNHPYHPHGNHMTQIAQDGRLLESPTGDSASSERFGETIGSGETEDYLIVWDDQDHWDPNTNPLPVPQPNYRDLTFKDSNTWYSGSPYLGYKGTLPTGTVSQNICGEWYFPWHSHALNEFTNYDQGFGGMATLLRVDPLGGCFVAPSSTRILVGSLNGGSATALAFTDSSYYKINSTTSGTRTTDWYAQVSGVVGDAENLRVTYTGRNCGTGTGACPATTSRSTTLYIWNWTTSSWTQLGAPESIGTTDATITRAVANPATPYVGTGSNRGAVRVRVLTSGGTTNFVTQANAMAVAYDAP